MKKTFEKYMLLALILAALMGFASKSFASDQVLCITEKDAAVYDDSLEVVLFLADRFEGLKVFQGWTDLKKETVLNGVKTTYVKVEFFERDEEDAETSIGWIPESTVQYKGSCPGFSEQAVSDDEEEATDQPATDIAGLDDPNCCQFPLSSTAKAAYTTGQRRFGAARSKGRRKHAACDLYHRNEEPVLSIANGKILRDRYYFYQGTYAVEVEYAAGFIVRYGELSGKESLKTKGQTTLAAGDEVGFIKKVNSNCCAPMLHFELYQGTKTGPLTQLKVKGFQRRTDLINPTKYLQAWESHNK